jgi:hypothetical protein
MNRKAVKAGGPGWCRCAKPLPGLPIAGAGQIFYNWTGSFRPDRNRPGGPEPARLWREYSDDGGPRSSEWRHPP